MTITGARRADDDDDVAQADINLDSGALGCIRGRVACFRGTPRKHALTISETFAGTAYTLNSDHSDGTNDAWCRAGNLIDDGQMRYTYDAWNRLVKVTRKQDTDIVIQTAEYDGLGRRVSKVVTKSGDLDGTYVYYYADTQAGGSMGGASPGGWSIAEIRDGSNNVYQQVYHGTQYIDEIVAMRLEKGYAVVYQDANWNTIATCDLAGRVLERVFTTPYGSPIIEPESFFGDYDGDGDVDATDDASLGSGQTCWGSNPSGACRVFDFNCDGTLNASDETIMTALVAAASTNRRHENRTVSPTRMEFLHQGLETDSENFVIANRARAISIQVQRFQQRDPKAEGNGSQESIESFHVYSYLGGNPLAYHDPFGTSICRILTPTLCGPWPPVTWNPPPTLPATKRNCNSYPADYCFMGVNGRCMCKCMGNDPWSMLVRGCLSCCYCNNYSTPKGCHETCYQFASDSGADRPESTLARCAAQCAGGTNGNPICHSMSGCPVGTVECDCGLGGGGQCLPEDECREFCKNVGECGWPND